MSTESEAAQTDSEKQLWDRIIKARNQAEGVNDEAAMSALHVATLALGFRRDIKKAQEFLDKALREMDKDDIAVRQLNTALRNDPGKRQLTEIFLPTIANKEAT